MNPPITNKQPDHSQFKTYLVDYNYEGSKWELQIEATSFEDAQKRLIAIRYGALVGELKFSIPVPIKESWFNNFRNWLRKIS